MSHHLTTDTWVRRGSLAAGIAYTATAEFELAVRLGATWLVAIMLPVAIDCYLIAALRRFRAFDIALSLTLMGAAQVAAHALDANVIQVSLTLVALVSLLVPVAIWRTHALARQTPKGAPAPHQDAEDATPAPAVPSVPQRPVVVPGDVSLLPLVARPKSEAEDAQDADGRPAPPPVLLSSAEVARWYGVEASTVRTWVAAGRLTVHTKDAGRNWFDRDALPDMAAEVTS